ncbi:molybdopterin converting factor subunit 1 [Ornithinibacillus xuwenensis]|uniref:Molybdopterin synthase sulfur carrier subunit n=1 Tax=Ornithinibacillus xuwenensis TaxID=3144668 RepID=A0ABU9XGI9_9BACI
MITVLLFAQLQEEMGKERFELEINELSVQDLKELIKQNYNLNQLDHVMVAINEEYALPSDIVSQGDVVAFIPPVSGG